MAESKEARVVEITIWFNAVRKMRIRADDRVSIDPGGGEVRFRRSGAASTDPDLERLVQQVLRKASDAISNQGSSITVLVENGKVLPDP